MAARKFPKLVFTAKIETTYGTDAVPTAVANAMKVRDITLTPLEAKKVERGDLLPYLGNQGVELAEKLIRMQFSVLVSGAGVAGTAPGYGPLLRACSLAEVITAGTSVVYSPVSDVSEAVTIYWNQDGVRHVGLGCRGNVTIDITPSKYPVFKFDMIGLFGTVTDVALPTPTLTAFKTALLVNKANSFGTLFGKNIIGESIMLDMGQKIEGRFLFGSESVELTDRSASGTMVLQADSVANWDLFATVVGRTRGALSVTHGVTAGNIVQFDAPQVEISNPTQGQTQNIINYSLPLEICPNLGNDELTITVK